MLPDTAVGLEVAVRLFQTVSAGADTAENETPRAHESRKASLNSPPPSTAHIQLSYRQRYWKWHERAVTAH